METNSKTFVPPAPQLKRLQFIPSTLSSATRTAERVYGTVRSYVPNSLKPTLSSVEQKVVSLGGPVLAKATDIGGYGLKFADSQVEYVVTTSDKTLSSGKQAVNNGLNTVQKVHQTNMKTFSDTTAAYYAWVQGIADWSADYLNPIKGGRAALDALRLALEKAQAATDPDVAAQMATDAWTSFASVPVVAKVLDSADPVTHAALSTCYALHDRLVGMGVYKSAVDTAGSTLTWVATTSPYKLGARHLYPLVQGAVDPTLSKLSNSKVVNSTVDYWKPAVVVA